MVLKIHSYLINFFTAHFLLKYYPNLPKYYKFNCRKNANFQIRHCLISGCLISGDCLIHQAHAGSNQEAAWSIRLLPDQNQAAAWLIRHMPDQNQASSWSIRLMPDQHQPAAWWIMHMPDQNKAAASLIRLLPDQNQTAAWLIRTLVCEKSTTSYCISLVYINRILNQTRKYFKTSRDRKRLPREHCICWQRVKLLLSKY